MPIIRSYLVLRVEEFELIIHERIFGALLLAQSALLLQLGAPEGLDAVHGGAELLIGQLQLLLQVGRSRWRSVLVA